MSPTPQANLWIVPGPDLRYAPAWGGKFLPLPSGLPMSPKSTSPYSILPAAVAALGRIEWHTFPKRLPYARSLGPGEMTQVVNELLSQGDAWGLLSVHTVRERGVLVFELGYGGPATL